MVHNFVPWMHLCIRFSPTRGQTFQEQKFMYSFHPSLLSTPKQAFAQMAGIIHVRDKGRTARSKVRESGDEGVSGFSRARALNSSAGTLLPHSLPQNSESRRAGFGSCPEEIYPSETYWPESSSGASPHPSPKGDPARLGWGVQKILHLALKAWRRG